MPSFNSEGLLEPNRIIECDLQTFNSIFTGLPTAKRRENIYEQYQLYMKELSAILGETPFVQWIDGSFVTKKTVPNDIDIVTFISLDDYNRLQNAFENFMQPKVSKRYKGLVDAYILPMEDNSRIYWENHFSSVKGRDKKIIRGKKKGFIQIKP